LSQAPQNTQLTQQAHKDIEKLKYAPAINNATSDKLSQFILKYLRGLK